MPLVSEPFEDTVLLAFHALRRIPGFAHCITTQPWNMATHRGPQSDQAVQRRRRVCEHLGLPFDRLTAADQIHSAHVLRIVPGDVGAGRADRASALSFIDGMVCGLPATPLLQFSADCPILLAVDARRRVFGTAHASWRGTVAGIAGELVRQLRLAFDVAPADLAVGIAPCAGPDRYEVGEIVFRIAAARFPEAEAHFPVHDGRRYFDLRAGNVAQLVAAGVRPEQICVAEECTISDARFYSHRREGPQTGRFGLIAGFKA